MPTPSRIFRRISRTSAHLAPLGLALALATAFAQTTTLATPPAETRSSLQDQQSVAVTIYNNDLALVKDTRRLTLAPGLQRIALRLLEQNFDFDLLTPQKLLEESVGDSVRVIRHQPITGVEVSEYATVLAANEGVVLKFNDRVEAEPAQSGPHRFMGVPANLRDRPTLSMVFRTEVAPTGFQSPANATAEQGMELSYLTGGLTWKADYVAELSSREDSIDLNGWVTLTNTSGTAYNNARLQLIAGTVNRTQPERAPMPMMAKAMAMADAAPAMQEEGLFEYHLYTLDRLTNLLDNQTKQVALLSAQKVKVDKEFRLTGGDWYYAGQHGDLGKKLKPSVCTWSSPTRPRRVRKARRPRRAPAQGHRPRLQEGQRRPRPIHRRGPHRPHRQGRDGQAEAGRGLRHHRRQEADRLPPPRDKQRRQLRGRKRLRDRAAQRQDRAGDGDRARTRARRLDHAGRIAAPRQGGGRQLLCQQLPAGLANHPGASDSSPPRIRGSTDRHGFGMASVRFHLRHPGSAQGAGAALSGFLGTEDSILYSSCFDANGGLFETLLGAEDAIISDALNHASIIDGVRLCKAQALSLRQQRHGRAGSPAQAGPTPTAPASS
jgi:hypothetical protein